MTIIDIAGDVKRRREPGDHHTHDEEASEVYFVKILRVKKEIRNAEILSKAPGGHRKDDDPAEQQDLITFQVV
jgi:hypothetical protein